MPRHYHVPEFFALVLEIGKGELCKGEAALPEQKAALVMQEVARAIAERCGGTTVYVPRALALQKTQRDLQLWQEYGQDGPDGARKYSAMRVQQLAQKHGMTVIHAYRILKMMRAQQVLARGRLKDS